MFSRHGYLHVAADNRHIHTHIWMYWPVNRVDTTLEQPAVLWWSDLHSLRTTELALIITYDIQRSNDRSRLCFQWRRG